jgi:hypothetical protein
MIDIPYLRIMTEFLLVSELSVEEIEAEFDKSNLNFGVLLRAYKRLNRFPRKDESALIRAIGIDLWEAQNFN